MVASPTHGIADIRQESCKQQFGVTRRTQRKDCLGHEHSYGARAFNAIRFHSAAGCVPGRNFPAYYPPRRLEVKGISLTYLTGGGARRRRELSTASEDERVNRVKLFI